MPGNMKFQYDPVNDLVIGTPHWKIETLDDIAEWYRQYEVFFSTFKRKMDLVVVLDDFAVATPIGPAWGEARARVHRNFIGHNFRVHSNAKVHLFVNTSGARYNVSTLEAASIEDAIEGIKEARRIEASQKLGV